jgi:hypothetical protein
VFGERNFSSFATPFRSGAIDLLVLPEVIVSEPPTAPLSSCTKPNTEDGRNKE